MKSNHTTYVNDDDSEIVWEVEDSIKKCLKIQKNVTRYEFFISKMLENKLAKKTIKKHLSIEDQEQLKSMLMDQTEIEVIKKATAEEIIDDGKSWMDKIKEKWKKE